MKLLLAMAPASTLDPLFALRTLLLPGSTVPLVRLPDQATAAASIATLSAALGAAQATPLGRARTALAAALHNISPGAIGTTVYVGLSWRQEAESRSGGNMSWNTGVDYRRMLARSAERDEVLALYREAGVTVERDLAALAAAPRISADRRAVAFMARNISFTGRLDKPLMTIHTTGDELVPVQVRAAYRDTAARAGRLGQLRQAFVDRAGHRTFTDDEMPAALGTLERRVTSGRWPPGLPSHSYVHYRPSPYPRPSTSPADDPPVHRRERTFFPAPAGDQESSWICTGRSPSSPGADAASDWAMPAPWRPPAPPSSSTTSTPAPWTPRSRRSPRTAARPPGSPPRWAGQRPPNCSSRPRSARTPGSMS
ncbi:hypothetical protein Acsp02_10080 [Actinoplanes sp. NBRC 103695]|nr:hypothetical protein Acsp02_10080 [Actinoplanes sp. NBRC 103695]